MKTLYLFRHGETDANKAGILQGHLNTTLSSRGHQQANQLGDYCRQLDLDLIHCSDLTRAKATAEPLLRFHSCPIIYSNQLREVSYGPLEGKVISQLNQVELHNLQQFYQAQIPLPYADAEPITQLEKRLLGYLKLILDHPMQNHAIVSHGQALNYLIHLLLGWPIQKMQMLELTNCSVTELKFDQLKWQLVRLNQDVTSIL